MVSPFRLLMHFLISSSSRSGEWLKIILVKYFVKWYLHIKVYSKTICYDLGTMSLDKTSSSLRTGIGSCISYLFSSWWPVYSESSGLMLSNCYYPGVSVDVVAVVGSVSAVK